MLRIILPVSVVLVLLGIVRLAELATIRQNNVRNFFIRLQPELDAIDILDVVKKDHVLKYQLKCLLNNDTLCDAVGRWLAPRLPFIFQGECPKCTQVQQTKIADALDYVRRAKPEIYKALLERYIEEDEKNSVMKQQLQSNFVANRRNNEIQIQPKNNSRIS